MIEKIGLVTVGLLTGAVGTIVTAKVITNRKGKGTSGDGSDTRAEIEAANSPLDKLADAVSEVVNVETW